MKSTNIKTSWKILNFLPETFSQKLIRRSLRIPTNAPADLEIKIAETKEELEQGFQLLYECYREDGLIDEHPSNIRVTKYHALPTSTMIVAKSGGVVVGTVSHVVDSPLRVPSDELVDLQEFRTGPARIAEISALAIRKNYRGKMSLLFYLTRYLYYFSRHYTGVRYWIISVRYHIKIFYQAVFFFQSLYAAQKSYSFVNGTLASTLYCDLENAPARLKQTYGNKEATKNLFDFYFGEHSAAEAGRLPKANYNHLNHSMMPPDLLDYFFCQRVNIFRNLTEEEKVCIMNAYFYPEYRKVIDSRSEIRFLSPRQFARFPLFTEGHLVQEDFKLTQIIPVHVLSASLKGLSVRLPKPSKIHGFNKVNVLLKPGKRVTLHTKPISLNGRNELMLSIMGEPPSGWQDFISTIDHKPKPLLKF